MGVTAQAKAFASCSPQAAPRVLRQALWGSGMPAPTKLPLRAHQRFRGQPTEADRQTAEPPPRHPSCSFTKLAWCCFAGPVSGPTLVRHPWKGDHLGDPGAPRTEGAVTWGTSVSLLGSSVVISGMYAWDVPHGEGEFSCFLYTLLCSLNNFNRHYAFLKLVDT